MNRSIATTSKQRGMTVVIVLMLLSVMLLGGLALARMTETGALVFGNVISKDGTLQASEAGLNAAYAAIPAAALQNVDAAPIYYASYKDTDTNGIPTGIDFATAGQVKVGTVNGAATDFRYDVRYVVERMCNVTAVTSYLDQCMVRLQKSTVENISADAPKTDGANRRQFRITVRVTDKRGTTTWVQAMATK